MSQGETLISILLAVIAYFLYHIARQLSFLTGKRIKFRFGLPKFPATKLKRNPTERSGQQEDEPKLPN